MRNLLEFVCDASNKAFELSRTPEPYREENIAKLKHDDALLGMFAERFLESMKPSDKPSSTNSHTDGGDKGLQPLFAALLWPFP